MPRVMHFELPSSDPQRSMTFFTDVFGWTFSQFGDADYWMCKTGENSEPGIDGAVMLRQDPAQPVVNSIVVDSVDDYSQRIIIAGGEIVVPKMAIGEVGFVSYFKDLDGNIHGIAEFAVGP